MTSDFMVDGARIMAVRRSRGISRRILANLVGCSEEWLRLIENGARPLDRLSTILRIADVLRISDLSELVGGDVALPAMGAQGEYDEIGHALLYPRRLSGEPGESVHRIARHVSAAWDVWQRSPRRYSEVRRRLPELLVMAETAPLDEEPAAAGLTQVYRLFSTFLRGCGQHALALLAADRGVAAAGRAGDPLLSAVARAELAEVLIHLRRYGDARQLCLAAIDGVGQAGPSAIAVAGGCYLTAAQAAAEENDVPHTEELLHRARKIGESLGEDRDDLHAPFGAAEVEAQAVAVAVRLGRYRQAIRLSGEIDPARLRARDRQARYFLSLARAHSMERDAAGATAMLRRVLDGCPEELAYNPQAARVMEQLRLVDCATTRGELREITLSTRLRRASPARSRAGSA
ncbi:helix-turn-helix domain-containing protein [Nonomuraea endophytica]|uniref:Transcriptional regulator with XRE-family HTH domain n=1 Tax=Nonomuraea endophytica TaxID=714136 RepID=A0A7W8AC47_9ACTN|nr:helix-turn-helix domain-containing protein [Nonomuraea endophytica]MBB5082475.1 transcriptional regulator with XRE-family HTH domain [Nonomuraea endophytica]